MNGWTSLTSSASSLIFESSILQSNVFQPKHQRLQMQDQKEYSPQGQSRGVGQRGVRPVRKQHNRVIGEGLGMASSIEDIMLENLLN